MIPRYGWKRDRLDHRDRLLSISAPVNLPPSADLRAGCPPVYDQGELGSCTANAIAAAIDFERLKEGKTLLFPSRLFIYYNERVLENDVTEDNGAEIRDGIKTIAAQGVCPESEYPYIPSAFAIKPSAKCYADALKFKTLQYSRVTQSPYYTKHCLGILRRPVVFGFSVFDAFESDTVAKTGKVPTPSAEDVPIGGHAVMLVGYDDVTQMYLVRNSWGPKWGIGGYFYMPYQYILQPDLASDFWTILAES